MTLSRRNFLKMTGAAVGVSALAACVPAVPQSGADVEGEVSTPAEPGALWVLHKQDFHDGYNEFLRAHIVSFAEQNDLELDVAFTAGFAGTGADIQKVAAAVQAGAPPDVWIDNINVFQLRQLGTVQTVSDLVADVVEQYGEPTQRLQNDTFFDGEYYAVPFHVRSDGGWARQDIFDAAGIDITALRTYDELREAALEVSDPANEIWGWGMTINRSNDGGYLVSRVLNGWGAFWTDETGEVVTIDTPEAVEAVEWLVDTYTNPQWQDMLPTGVISWTDTANNEAYLGGTIAYTQNAGTVYATAVRDGLEVADLTIYDPPKGGPALESFNGLGGMHHQLIEGAPNPDMARELILSFFTDEVLTDVYANAVAYAVPAYEGMWEWEVITSNPLSLAQREAALDPTGWNGLAFPGPNTAQMGAVSTGNIHTDMVGNVVSGQMSAAEAVQNAHQQSVQIFQEFGAAGE